MRWPKREVRTMGIARGYSRREFLAIVSATSTAVIVSACASQLPTGRPSGASAPTPASTVPGNPVRGGTVNVGVDREAGSIDPHRPVATTAIQYSSVIFNTLTRLEPNGNVSGELAESWSAPDAKTYLFNLRK